MTPKRRAALHKAQMASARKRKKSRNRKIAIGIGVGSAAVLGTATAAYLGKRYIHTLASGGSKTPRFDAYMALPKQLALPPGTGLNTHRNRKLVLKRPRAVHRRNGAFKVSPDGVATYIRRPRGTYNAQRRAGLVSGYQKKIRSKYAPKTFDGAGMSPRTQRRRNKKRG